MHDLFAKCGFNCGHCPSYKENLKTDKDRQQCSDGWYRYHGFRFTPEKLVCCDGCQVPADENPVRYLRSGCYIRRCAEKNSAETCAHCSGYPCEDIKRVGGANSREVSASRLGILPEEIPKEDYLTFIEPYEGLTHLDAIRNSLNPEDIVKMITPSPAKVQPFPELPFSKEEVSAFEAVYQLLAKVLSVTGDTHARQTVLEKKKKYFLKLLWVFGLYGEFEEGALTIDSKTYLDQLKGVPFYSTWEAVKERFEILEEHGVHCDLVPLTEKWLTPKGALRKGTWSVKMSFTDTAGGVAALKALKDYAANLDEKYNKRGYRFFSKADMRSLI